MATFYILGVHQLALHLVGYSDHDRIMRYCMALGCFAIAETIRWHS